MWPWFILSNQIYGACSEAGYWKVRIHIQRIYKPYVLVIHSPGYVLALLVTQCKGKFLHNVACLLEVPCILPFYLKLTWRKQHRNLLQPSLASSTEILCCKLKLVPAFSFNKALYIQIFTLEVTNDSYNNTVLPYF